ncbi:hypothetical protein [Ancylobacter mangrovi]|uniref:DUF968 domain-containing protein n=1 Tax=Ancylobacter mangrovi TaxID=2972472 RepID=A0A9X2T633_9HYPH|nr:hypothetical protein [Ancylobacter mangrovi]MCS0497916.1 hypothetical protein [Ancylobacter mangrovi]MCS0501566.1 hypothetical protein [Ancylobacter mangrovi]
MAFRIETGVRPNLKSARRKRQRPLPAPRARLKDETHLRILRQLPCLVSGTAPAGEAAHIRYASALHGKGITGIGTKPDDKWAVPLCVWLHTMSSGAQHRDGEEWWWEERGIDPLFIAAQLYAVSVAMRDAKVPEHDVVRQLTRMVIDFRRNVG